MKANIYNKSGKKLSKTVELNKKVFSVKPSEHSIYLTVKSELASKRQGTHSSKTRAEVRGGGAKPWKQKGTGRARVGSTRNPARVHGGSAFGPKPRRYDIKVNKKTKKIARISALSLKISSDAYKIVDDLAMPSSKTKDFNDVISKLDLQNKKVTMVVGDYDKNLFLSSRNLFLVNMVSVLDVSTYDIMNSDTVLFDESSINKLNELV